MGEEITLVARKACFGLPTACPSCLPVYIYLKFAQLPFSLDFNLIYPDSEQIPYVESGTYVTYNNEKGGVIENLKEDGIIDLDSAVHSIPEWVSMKAMVSSWLTDALLYELWVGSDGGCARKIYYCDLPWPIGKFLYFKQSRATKQLLGITKENVEQREEEIYRRAASAYEALSTRLGDNSFFFENRPTTLDAIFLAHALFTLQALPETSVLRRKLLEYSNLLQYAEKLKAEFIEGGLLSSSPPVRADPSSSSSFPRRGGASNSSSKAKSKTKREKTEEEKKFRRRAKYFLATQLVTVLVFLSLLGGSDDADVELDEEDGDGLYYND